MTTTNLAGAPALQGLNRIEAVQMTTLAFNNGGLLPNGGVVQFNSYGLRTSVPRHRGTDNHGRRDARRGSHYAIFD